MIARAIKAPKHIVLAEGLDPRIVQGAARAVRDGLANITLLGPVNKVRALTRAAGDEHDKIAIIDPGESNALNFANTLVSQGQADGSVAGAIHTTSDVVRSALKTIGVHENFELVSSLFIMIMPETSDYLDGAVAYSDCGLVIDPNANQLADIAVATSKSAKALLSLEPKIAMLSFATHESAKHAHVDKVKAATQHLKSRYPDLSIDGPLQFDAAISADIARLKAPDSAIGGKANVFIFPDLNAGNIAYKITERLAGAKAIGPILQGLARPANDLSRGCDAEAVYNMIAVTALQAQALEND